MNLSEIKKFRNQVVELRKISVEKEKEDKEKETKRLEQFQAAVKERELVLQHISEINSILNDLVKNKLEGELESQRLQYIQDLKGELKNLVEKNLLHVEDELKCVFPEEWKKFRAEFSANIMIRKLKNLIEYPSKDGWATWRNIKEESKSLPAIENTLYTTLKDLIWEAGAALKKAAQIANGEETEEELPFTYYWKDGELYVGNGDRTFKIGKKIPASLKRWESEILAIKDKGEK